ncbi:hypothetical protein AKO1_004728, partial [Acrasis kona]
MSCDFLFNFAGWPNESFTLLRRVIAETDLGNAKPSSFNRFTGLIEKNRIHILTKILQDNISLGASWKLIQEVKNIARTKKFVVSELDNVHHEDADIEDAYEPLLAQFPKLKNFVEDHANSFSKKKQEESELLSYRVLLNKVKDGSYGMNTEVIDLKPSPTQPIEIELIPFEQPNIPTDNNSTITQQQSIFLPQETNTIIPSCVITTTFWIYTGVNVSFNLAFYRTPIFQIPLNVIRAGLSIVDLSLGRSGQAWDKNTMDSFFVFLQKINACRCWCLVLDEMNPQQVQFMQQIDATNNIMKTYVPHSSLFDSYSMLSDRTALVFRGEPPHKDAREYFKHHDKSSLFFQLVCDFVSQDDLCLLSEWNQSMIGVCLSANRSCVCTTFGAVDADVVEDNIDATISRLEGDWECTKTRRNMI